MATVSALAASLVPTPLAYTYCGSSLSDSHVIAPADNSWRVTADSHPVDDGTAYVFTFVAQRPMDEAGVAVAVDVDGWSSDNYVMIPASVYGGNRQRIVNRSYATGLDATDYYRADLALTSNPIPQLSPEYGAPSRLEVLTNNTATPAMVWLDRLRRRGGIIITEQGIERDGAMIDHGLTVAETTDRSRATFTVSAPGVRSRKPEFIGFSDSPDRGLSVDAGDSIVVRLTVLDFSCDDVPALLDRFMRSRKTYSTGNPVRDLVPMSRVLQLTRARIDSRYREDERSAYYCPENAEWMSYGWIGGMMNTFPMLAAADDARFERVSRTFDFGLAYGPAESGYFREGSNPDGSPLLRDASSAHPDIALTRRNGDMLYWLVKQMMLMEKTGRTVKPEWKEAVKRLADAFTATWRKHGTWGNYLDTRTGDVAVFNTTGGALVPGGLTLASLYFNEPVYLAVAREAARKYYDDFALRGFTSGGCGDILQNADSETSVALLTSLVTMYESTGEPQYLKEATDLANLCATWTSSFAYRLPAATQLARLGANMTGVVWASTQNKHGAPGFCTQSADALFKIYRATGNRLYADLLRDIIHAHAEGLQPDGRITERLTYCDADSRGDRLEGGSTGWNETNGAMMAIEIPGIYLRTDTDEMYVFDHVKARIVSRKPGRIVIEVSNPTEFDAEVSLLAEDAVAAAKPLGENSFTDRTATIRVRPGKQQKYTIKI